jgi:hypothetical protein
VDGKWKLVEPSQGVLDNDALQRVLDAFATLRAESFVREGHDNLGEYGLDEPETTLIATAGEKTYTLALGKSADPDKKFALWADPALVFTISTGAANTLAKNVVVTMAAPPVVPGPADMPPATAVSPTDEVVPASPTTPTPTNLPAKQQ